MVVCLHSVLIVQEGNCYEDVRFPSLNSTAYNIKLQLHSI